jgi:pyruvate/2-oxoglutarate dehydrogenase complex dihydrolipoamide dehydrogenase (E3) component
VEVVLVQEGPMGGDCLNAGCVPSKALIAAGDRAHAMRGAGIFGIEAVEPRVDFARVRAHVREVIAGIAPNDSVERYAALGVRVIRARARFTDPRTVRAGPATIRARRFVIATGSRPAVPPIPGLEGVTYLTNETVFDLAERPRRLLVIGGGPVGAELAQAHRRLGAEVVVIESGAILSREDPEMAAVVARALLAEGVELRPHATVERVERRSEGVAVAVRKGGEAGEGTEMIEGSHLLVATGRQPVTGDMGLEEAGVAVDRTGIVVDRGLRTGNRRIYAVGDCAGSGGGSLRFTHVANYHAGLVIRSALFRLPVRVDTSAIPRVTYTDPEVASVGLTEAQAVERGAKFRILRWPVAENDRAQAERALAGHAKAIVTQRGAILGCSIAAPNAGELIMPWVLAMAKGLKVQDLAGLVFPYPTLSEVTKRAAVEHLRPQAANPWLRRLIGVARRFG